MKFSLITGLAAMPLVLAAPATGGHDTSVDGDGHEGGVYGPSDSSDHRAYDDKKGLHDYGYNTAPTPTTVPVLIMSRL